MYNAQNIFVERRPTMKRRLRLSYVLTRYFVCLLAGAVPLIANAALATGWVAEYDGSAGDYDRVHAIAVDAEGNIYVTGGSHGSELTRDYATVKYGPDGEELWVKTYNGPASRYDRAYAIAVDGEGNVYVTGESTGSGTGGDYATVKYDPDGKELWVKRYNGWGNSSDAARAMAVDGEGNVYVTGSSSGGETYYDYATVKYDSNGNQLWVKGYNGPGSGNDIAIAIAVDGFGNVYLTGRSKGSGTWDDYATVKYDTGGNELWVKRYNGPANSNDMVSAIAVDTSENVYVTGESYLSETVSIYATVKYDTNGNQCWMKRYNGPASRHNYASAIAVDAEGNVYVTGRSGDWTVYDYATVKYDTDGNELWVKRYNGPANGNDIASAIAVDTSKNVYVTGSSSGGETYYDYATVKYDSNGSQLWVKRYNGSANGDDEASAIAVDTLGNVYVAGGSEVSNTDWDYVTVKYGEPEEVEVKMDLPADWSMISLPVVPQDACLASLFPEAVVVYKYQKGTGYVPVQAEEKLEGGMGYWILLDEPKEYVLMGTKITQYTIPVSDQWYLIGGCTDPAQRTLTEGNIKAVHGYAQDGGYTTLRASDPLEQGKGYWILFSNTSEGSKFTAGTLVSE
jgi:hypothetical protein